MSGIGIFAIHEFVDAPLDAAASMQTHVDPLRTFKRSPNVSTAPAPRAALLLYNDLPVERDDASAAFLLKNTPDQDCSPTSRSRIGPKFLGSQLPVAVRRSPLFFEAGTPGATERTGAYYSPLREGGGLAYSIDNPAIHPASPNGP